ncbi:MAG TPA: hypothetical protein DIV79_14585 [Opitutae bacterium]|nr:hypothetical protein [Opitutae bacterium]
MGYLVRAVDFQGWRSRNNFRLERARITAWGEEKSSHHNVPDSGHRLILFGLGFVALAGWSRFANKRS